MAWRGPQGISPFARPMKRGAALFGGAMEQPLGQMDAEALQQREGPGQIQRHDDHEKGRKRLDGRLEEAAGLENRAKRANQAAQGRVGKDAPQVVEQIAAHHPLSALRRMAALRQVDSPAHGHAMDGGHKAHDKHGPEAHALPCQGKAAEKGGEAGDGKQAVQRRAQRKGSQQGKQLPKPSAALNIIALRLQGLPKIGKREPFAVPQGGQGAAAVVGPGLLQAAEGGNRTNNGLLAMDAMHAANFPGHFFAAHRPFFQFLKLGASSVSSSWKG